MVSPKKLPTSWIGAETSGDCPSGKIFYEDGQEARLTARRIAKARGGGKMTAYDCERCDGWHLTSQNLKKRGKR